MTDSHFKSPFADTPPALLPLSIVSLAAGVDCYAVCSDVDGNPNVMRHFADTLRKHVPRITGFDLLVDFDRGNRAQFLDVCRQIQDTGMTLNLVHNTDADSNPFNERTRTAFIDRWSYLFELSEELGCTTSGGPVEPWMFELDQPALTGDELTRWLDVGAKSLHRLIRQAGKSTKLRTLQLEHLNGRENRNIKRGGVAVTLAMMVNELCGGGYAKAEVLPDSSHDAEDGGGTVQLGMYLSDAKDGGVIESGGCHASTPVTRGSLFYKAPWGDTTFEWQLRNWLLMGVVRKLAVELFLYEDAFLRENLGLIKTYVPGQIITAIAHYVAQIDAITIAVMQDQAMND